MDLSSFILAFLFSFGAFGSGGGISIGASGEFYVADAANSRIVRYSPGGDSTLAIGGRGWDENGFDAPQGLSASFLAGIFVADQNNHKVKQFQRDLSFVTELFTRNSAEERERFGFPSDVALQRNGDILVCDTENFRIVQFTSQGKHRRTFGQFDAGPGRLKNPSRIAVNAKDEIFVLDGSRIVGFDPFGNFTFILENFCTGSIRAIACSEEYLLAAEDSVLHVFRGSERVSTARIPEAIAQPWQDLAAGNKIICFLGKNSAFVFKTEFVNSSK